MGTFGISARCREKLKKTSLKQKKKIHNFSKNIFTKSIKSHFYTIDFMCIAKLVKQSSNTSIIGYCSLESFGV
jgi:hypothetical protein